MAWHWYKCPDCHWDVLTRSAQLSTVKWAEHWRDEHLKENDE